MAKNKDAQQNQEQNNKFSELFDLKLILSGLALFIIIALISFSLPNLKPFFVPKDTDVTGITVKPDLTKQGIEEAKKSPDTPSISYDKTAVVFDQPIPTPVFITNPDKLTEYLGRISKNIELSGRFKNAYLFIKTGAIDINNESVYFYIVDGGAIGGHLVPTGSLIPDSGNEFLYDMHNLPTVQLPYSLKKKVDKINVVNDILNFVPQNGIRRFYIGAFVSTTRLPNQIERLEIRYTCESSALCDIKII